MNDNVKYGFLISLLLSESSSKISNDIVVNNDEFKKIILANSRKIDVKLLEYFYIYLYEIYNDNPNQLFYISPDNKSFNIVRINKNEDSMDYTIHTMSKSGFEGTPIVDDIRNVIYDKKNDNCFLHRRISYFTPERIEILRLVCEDKNYKVNFNSLHILDDTNKLRIVKVLFRNIDDFSNITELIFNHSNSDLKINSFISSGSTLDNAEFKKDSMYDKSLLTRNFLKLINNADDDKFNKPISDNDSLNINSYDEQLNVVKGLMNELNKMSLDNAIYDFLDELYDKGFGNNR